MDGKKKTHKLTVWWRKMGIRNRLLALFSLLVFVSVGSCAAVLAVYWSKDKLDDFDSYAGEITQQVSKSVDACLENLDRLAISIAYSDNIQEVLGIDYQKYVSRYASNARQAGWYLANAKNSYSGIQSIYVYDLQGYLFSTPMNFVNTSYQIQQEEWFEDFAESEEYTCVVGPYVNQQETYPDEEVISVARKIKSMETMEDAGYILINVKIEDILNNNLQRIWEADGGSLVIVTEQNHIVFDSGSLFEGNTEMEKEWFSMLSDAGSHFDYRYQNKNNRVALSKCENSGWYILRIVEYAQLYLSVRQMMVFSLMIAAGIILLAFFPMMGFLNSFVKPITRLQKSMMKLTTDSFDPFTEPEEEEIFLPKPEKGNNEIDMLTESFNHMAVRLYSLIQTIYHTENEKHKLEIAALSAQINPHFTYNTLGTIKQMALLQNSKGIADLTDAIVNLLRATAKYGDGSSTIGKELDLIRDYIFIMQMRYYDNFEFHISAEQELLDQPILCMLIQPIVENAIFHGVFKVDRLCFVKIEVLAEAETIRIIVSDNGKGIEPKEMEKFLEESGLADKKHENIGVYNVNRRIQLHYGKEYGLKFQKNQPYGTIVTIVIPRKG